MEDNNWLLQPITPLAQVENVYAVDLKVLSLQMTHVGISMVHMMKFLFCSLL